MVANHLEKIRITMLIPRAVLLNPICFECGQNSLTMVWYFLSIELLLLHNHFIESKKKKKRPEIIFFLVKK